MDVWCQRLYERLAAPNFISNIWPINAPPVKLITPD